MFSYTDPIKRATDKIKKREELEKKAYMLFRQTVEEVDKNDKSGNPVRLSDLFED